MNKVGLKNNFSLLLKEEAKWLTAYHNNKQFGYHFFPEFGVYLLKCRKENRSAFIYPVNEHF